MRIPSLSRYPSPILAIYPGSAAALMAMDALPVYDDPEKVLAVSNAAAASRKRPAPPGGIAHILVQGTIEPRTDVWTIMSGGTGLDMIKAEFAAAIANPDVGGVLMEFDSPGGSAAGVAEMAQIIRSARGVKPISAHANAFAASAAVYLASQADEFVGTPSAMVGSIGVISVHTDLRAAAEKAGVAYQFFRSTARKADVNPFEPLSEEAAAELQQVVDAFDRMFVADVALGRGMTPAGVEEMRGAGRMFLADEALRVGLIDRVEPIEATYARLRAGMVVSRQAPGIRAGGSALESPIEEDQAAIAARLGRLWEISLQERDAWAQA